MIGTQIKILRTNLKMTQTKFAEAIDKKMRTIQDWELGKSNPTSKGIDCICKTFGISKAWLLTGENEMYQCISENTAATVKDSDDNYNNYGKSKSTDSSSILSSNKKELINLLDYANNDFILKCIQHLEKQKNIKNSENDIFQ